MRKLLFLAGISFFFLFSVLGQIEENYKQNTNTVSGVDVCLSFDNTGEIVNGSIASNEFDKQNNLPLVIEKEKILIIVEELVPVTKRGKKIDEINQISLGRASIETVIYEKIIVDLTIVCRREVCGVVQAKIKKR